MTMKKYNLVNLVFLIALAGLCCGGMESLTYVADEEKTLQDAKLNEITYCNIFSDRICQSSDSILIFEFPLEIEMFPSELIIEDEIEVYNDGFYEASIWEYQIKLVDDSARVYDADFRADNTYNDDHPFHPALELQTHERMTIRFNAVLNPRAGGVKSIIIDYKEDEFSDYTRLIVSYHPTYLKRFRKDDVIE